ncbi:amidohydrolase family protein [Phyllobacterium sophorae]|uniref:Amidohydrolase-related domain-containing protein n=1 Tax=Phyllobacterium sophorae TaxID=1520277 RepID=A0A2P7B319_9HYPH|nr:amidohydrolase family protein [Phyllobacterium sophorae]PSH60877.1 hypothetical protein CU103_25265 [Phyllobacterium sophorae]
MSDSGKIWDGRKFSDVGVVDCHVHIFGSSREMAVPRFPHPEQPASLVNVEELGNALGIQRYVLTQPSFLGFDNTLILDTILARPSDLRGVVWLDPAQDPAAIEALAAKGVAGLRFPLKYASNLPDWSAYEDIFMAAARHGIHVELGLTGQYLVDAMHKILDHSANVVIAHLGMFDAELGPDRDPAFDAVLEAAQSRRVWMKLSAPYRSSEIFANRACQRILERIGAERTVWGSDWPHVGPKLDRQTTYAQTLRWLLKTVTVDATRRQIFVTSPQELYRFGCQDKTT